jgi:hypothetical protein
LQRITALYAIVAQLRGQPPDVRRSEAPAHAGPLLDEMHAWLTCLVGRVSVKSELAWAIGYSLTRRRELTRYRTVRNALKHSNCVSCILYSVRRTTET